jgi:polyisoprenoid-binding protein YceI
MKGTFAKIGLFGLTTLALCGFVRRTTLLQDFTLEDSKGANGFSFSLTDGLEPVFGTGNDVTGLISFNTADPSKSTGSIKIGIKSLRLTSEVMSENMKGSWCLDAEKYPTATFEVKSAKLDKTDKKGIMSGTATGLFTARGISKQITVRGTARYVKGGVKTRFGDKDGDLLMLQCEFDFNRFDYKIGSDLDDKLIGNRVHVRFDCAAMAFSKS